MRPDSELLCLYAERGDESAFAEVVRRHLNLVYASAVRLLNGDTTLAEDVAQAVFADMARKAAELAKHASVVGWLHTSVRFAASSAVRTEQRRRAREQEASAMSDTMTATQDMFWGQMRPLIDEAVGQLQDRERDALLLRFFEEKSHREVGLALGMTENAARMRIERALDKLRVYFARHGVTASAALLVSTLSMKAASVPAPVGLATKVIANSLAGVGAKAGGLAAKSWVQSWFGAKGQGALVAATALGAVAFASVVYVHFENKLPTPPKQVALAVPAKNMAKQKEEPGNSLNDVASLAPAAGAAAGGSSPVTETIVQQAADLVEKTGQNAEQTATHEAQAEEKPTQDQAATETPGDTEGHAIVEVVWEPEKVSNSKVTWENAQPFSEGLAAVKRNGKWGYIDTTGQVVLPPRWTEAGAFAKGLAPVREVGDGGQKSTLPRTYPKNWGYIDRTGKMTAAPQWMFAGGFSDGLAPVSVEDTFATHPQWGYIDPASHVVIKPQWTWASGFSEGLATVAQGDQWAMIDQTGNQVIDLTKLGVGGVTSFSEGLAPVYVRWKGWAYIDKSGQRVIEGTWDKASGFAEGLARVASIDAKAPTGLNWAYIDRTGNQVLDLAKLKFADCLSFSEGLAGVYSLSAQKWGFIDKTGKVAIAPKFDEVQPFSEDLAAVRIGKQWGFVDQTGAVVIGKFTVTTSSAAYVARVTNAPGSGGTVAAVSGAGSSNGGVKGGQPPLNIVVQPLPNKSLAGGTLPRRGPAGPSATNSTISNALPPLTPNPSPKNP